LRSESPGLGSGRNAASGVNEVEEAANDEVEEAGDNELEIAAGSEVEEAADLGDMF